MKSKIDEVIDVLKTKLIETIKMIVLDATEDSTELFEDGFEGDLLDLLNQDLQILDTLRPYVEFYDSVELWSTGKDLLLFKIERKLFNKIKRQIKEQGDDV